MNTPFNKTSLSPWTIQWIVVASFGIRYFLANRLPPLSHEVWSLFGWQTPWSVSLRWANILFFLIFILAWFWIHRQESRTTQLMPIILLHLFTPLLVLTATWSPLPALWLFLLLGGWLAQQKNLGATLASLLFLLLATAIEPLCLLTLPTLFWPWAMDSKGKKHLKSWTLVAGIACFIAVSYVHGQPWSVQLWLSVQKQNLLHFGFIEFIVLGSLLVIAFQKARFFEKLPPSFMRWWSVGFPLLAFAFCSTSPQQGYLALQLASPFLFACAFGLIAPKVTHLWTFPIALVLISPTIWTLTPKLQPRITSPFLQVAWLQDAKRSQSLQLLMSRLETAMGPDAIILASPQNGPILRLLVSQPVLPYPPKGPNDSYNHLHKSGFWVMEHEPSADEQQQASAILDHLRPWREISFDSNHILKNHHYWIYQFQQLKAPY